MAWRTTNMQWFDSHSRSYWGPCDLRTSWGPHVVRGGERPAHRRTSCTPRTGTTPTVTSGNALPRLLGVKWSRDQCAAFLTNSAALRLDLPMARSASLDARSRSTDRSGTVQARTARCAASSAWQTAQVATRCASPRRPSRACLPAFRSGRDTTRGANGFPMLSPLSGMVSRYPPSVGRTFVAIQLIC